MALVDSANAAVQALEKLVLGMKRAENHQALPKTLETSISLLESLRNVKSEVEGSAVQYEETVLCEDTMQSIKQIILMHTPQTLTMEDKEKLATLINKAFQGTCKEVIFACLLTCSFYASTQQERGQQARHNSVFVVYTAKLDQIIAPVNAHVIEGNQVIDQEWLYAAEAYHYAHYLCKGKVRFVELLSVHDSAVLISTPQWAALKQHINSKSTHNLRGFLEQCRGMAGGTVGRKSKRSKSFQMRDTATLRDMCDSCRLLSHADAVIKSQALHVTSLHKEHLQPYAVQALDMITAMYQGDHTNQKLDVFNLLMKWKDEIDTSLKGHQYTDLGQVKSVVEQWLLSIRTRNGELMPDAVSTNANDTHKLQGLQQHIGGSVSTMNPNSILLVARVGSYLYGLATPHSDADYTVIYAEDTQRLLSSVERMKCCIESRGPDKLVEYGAYEAQLFTEMLWKGSVCIAELLFVDDLEYMSETWKDLLQHKECFITERLIQQYWGLIKNNMVNIQQKKYTGQPREWKLFYQITHKLDCISDLLDGRCPGVRSTGHRRDHIMKLRQGDQQTELSRDSVVASIQARIEQLRDKQANRERRLAENVDYTVLQNWLMKVRGFNMA